MSKPRNLPVWLNAEDVSRDAAFVDALRSVAIEGLAALEKLDAANDLTGWRWRIDALTADALEHARLLRKFADGCVWASEKRREREAEKQAMDAAEAELRHPTEAKP